jgi:predicted Zn-dependent protease
MNRFEKANSQVKLEQYDQALHELKVLETMLPKEPQIFLLMGKIYKKLNKINESYKYFRYIYNRKMLLTRTLTRE